MKLRLLKTGVTSAAINHHRGTNSGSRFAATRHRGTAALTQGPVSRHRTAAAPQHVLFAVSSDHRTHAKSASIQNRIRIFRQNRPSVENISQRNRPPVGNVFRREMGPFEPDGGEFPPGCRLSGDRQSNRRFVAHRQETYARFEIRIS